MRGPRDAPGDPPGAPPRPRRRQRRGSRPPGEALGTHTSRERAVRGKPRGCSAAARRLVEGLAAVLVELVRFLGETVVEVLLVGLLRAVGDHVWKPLLTATLENLVRPLLLFLLELLRGVAELAGPVAAAVTRVCSPLAALLRAVRLVEVHVDRRTPAGG